MVFSALAAYYDLLYRDKNYSDEADYVVQLVRQYNPKVHSMLELGCGTGNHAQFITKKGFEVTGIEKSNEMVQIAKAKVIQGFTPVHGDITDFKLSARYDAAISLFHVISYLNSNQDLIQCFKNVNAHLNQDGLFIFDVWYSPAVYFNKPEPRIKKLRDDRVEVTRVASPVIHANENVVEVNYEIVCKDLKTGISEVIHESHAMRHFSIPEMGLLAGLAGFHVVEAKEFVTQNEPSINTWGICFVLRKIG